MSIRSIGCFGFKKIDLVNPRNKWPNEKGISASKHFSSIAKSVKIFSTIPEAIKKSDIVIATTIRQRDIKIPQIKIEDLKKINAKIDKFYFCPFHPKYGSKYYKKDSYLRKPNPGMIIEIKNKYKL